MTHRGNQPAQTFLTGARPIPQDFISQASGRATWHRKVGRPVTFWLVVLPFVLLAKPWVPSFSWLVVHIVTLGLITTSIMVWSQHFTEALLKNRLPDSARLWQVRRIYTLTVAIFVIIAGMLNNIFALTFMGSLAVGIVLACHGFSLLWQLKKALPARFRSTVYFYIVAAWTLPLGAVCGALLTYPPVIHRWYAQLLLAHEAINILGFVGITVVGTLMTLWPTMLRTRMHPQAVRLSLVALAMMSWSVLVILLGAFIGAYYVSGAGFVLYAVAIGLVLVLMVQTCAAKKPVDYSTGSVLCAVFWLFIAVVVASFLVLNASSFADVNMRVLTPIFVAGFLLQVLLGSMTYLFPVQIGGGPSAVRSANAIFNRYAWVRISVINLALLVSVGFEYVERPLPPLTASLGVLGFCAFIPLMVLSVRASVRGRARLLEAQSRGEKVQFSLEQTTQQIPAIGREVSVGVALVMFALIVDGFFFL
ncbi:hypothetical protein [Rothia sp. P7208]|uniref:hypothetical protein n=1 Tax=Rothia sp. P7208 TaxID=3402660 RepID=UPI003AD5D633